MTLLDTSPSPHGRAVFDRTSRPRASTTPCGSTGRPADDWLLYTQDSPTPSGARGFTRGAIYTQDGTLIASVAQEGLIRERRDLLNQLPTFSVNLPMTLLARPIALA